MPLNLLAATSPFKVELGVMELHIWAKQVLSDIYKRASTGKSPIFFMMVYR